MEFYVCNGWESVHASAQMGGKLGRNSEDIVSHEGVQLRMLVCGDGLTGGHFLLT